MNEDVANFIKDISQRDFIVFAGAGVPEITRIPTWKELLKALAQRIKITGVEIEEVEPYLYPEVAQMLFSMYDKKNNLPEYYNIIEEEVQPKATSHSILQQKIVLASGRIVTTNYDDTFERAFNDLKASKRINADYKWQSNKRIQKSKVDEDNSITYLHGKYNEKTIVFKTTDYEKAYPSLNGKGESSTEKLLRYIYCKSQKALVFVGFSFNDRYVKRTIENMYKEQIQKRQQYPTDPEVELFFQETQHYALMEDLPKLEDDDKWKNIIKDHSLTQQQCEDLKNDNIMRKMRLEEKLKEMKINVIRYEHGKHVQLEEWFEEINLIKSTQLTARPNRKKRDNVLCDISRES